MRFEAALPTASALSKALGTERGGVAWLMGLLGGFVAGRCGGGLPAAGGS